MLYIVLKVEKMKEILSSWMIGIAENSLRSCQCRLATSDPLLRSLKRSIGLFRRRDKVWFVTAVILNE